MWFKNWIQKSNCRCGGGIGGVAYTRQHADESFSISIPCCLFSCQVGFDELGGKDDFSTEELEDRLAKAGVIESADGKPGRAYAPTTQSKRSVRQGSSSYQDNDSEGD